MEKDKRQPIEALTPEAKDELYEMRVGVLSGLDTYYQAEIRRLDVEKDKIEANLTKTLHKMNLFAGGLIAIILAIIVSITIMLYGSTLVIGTDTSSESYGDMEFSGENAHFKTNDTNIGDGNTFTVPEGTASEIFNKDQQNRQDSQDSNTLNNSDAE